METPALRRLLRKFLPKSWVSDAITVPVIRLHGTIMSGGGQFRPSLSLASTAGLIEKAFAYNDAPVVAISINSPGGSPVQSRLIYRRIRLSSCRQLASHSAGSLTIERENPPGST